MNTPALKIVPFRVARDEPNLDAVEKIEALLDRLKAGEAVGCAFVEVRADRTVTTGWSGSARGDFHQLNSGAALLSARLSKD